VYVQIIDLSRGARLVDAYEFHANPGSSNNPDPLFNKRTVPEWFRLEQERAGIQGQNPAWVYSAVNGQWYRQNGLDHLLYPETALAFPLKSNHQLLTGSMPNPAPRSMFGLYNNATEARITPYTYTTTDWASVNTFLAEPESALVSYAGDYTGQEINSGGDPSTQYARTWLGVYDSEENGTNDIILILSAQFPTHQQAAQILQQDFGSSDTIQLDGGGSTQLVTRGQPKVRSNEHGMSYDRWLPHALVVYEAPDDVVFSADEISFPTTDGLNHAIVGKNCGGTEAQNVDLRYVLTAADGWTVDSAFGYIDSNPIDQTTQSGYNVVTLQTQPGVGVNLAVGSHTMKITATLRNSSGQTREATYYQTFTAQVVQPPCSPPAGNPPGGYPGTAPWSNPNDPTYTPPTGSTAVPPSWSDWVDDTFNPFADNGYTSPDARVLDIKRHVFDLWTCAGERCDPPSSDIYDETYVSNSVAVPAGAIVQVVDDYLLHSNQSIGCWDIETGYVAEDRIFSKVIVSLDGEILSETSMDNGLAYYQIDNAVGCTNTVYENRMIVQSWLEWQQN
jgi:hypothetical protein